MKTERLTMSQAVVRFLVQQHVERDREVSPFFGGVAGIFGHGNLAGVGQALLQYRDLVRYYQVRNEQAMVHMATGYAKMRNRLGTLACTSSIGPGATNMITGAATATVNRLPVLLLPGDIFSTRRAGAVLQQLESSWSQDLSVNDAFKPVSRYWDRINRPEQLPAALMEAMRVLTSPAETGAVTLALPQDVQAEAWDYPVALFEPRIWPIARNRPDVAVLQRAAELIHSARRPLVIAGGGVIYSDASRALGAFVTATGIPVGETQAGKGSLCFDHAQSLGAIGASGSAQANAIAREADLVIGIGTRYTDFTTASRTLFGPDTVFVNINVAELDSHKHAGVSLTGDARATLELLSEALAGWSLDDERRRQCVEAGASWRAEIVRLTSPEGDGPPTQAATVGMVNRSAAPKDVVVCAAGSLPGDLHRLWCARDPKGYHMEYGFSCMGYEIAGALGAKMAAPEREVYSMVGDGSWLMMSNELLTAVQEGIKLIVVLVDNHGFGSIAALSEVLGSQAFGTRFRMRDADGELAGENLPVDLPGNARSLGVDVFEARSPAELEDALCRARASDVTTVVYVEIDPTARFGGSGASWDVPVAEVATVSSTIEARQEYERAQAEQTHYLGAGLPAQLPDGRP
jgi:3D-(3,5/4)-trihydroxycyclohexane-1,2-dione acylhydrolase (decyclizing)